MDRLIGAAAEPGAAQLVTPSFEPPLFQRARCLPLSAPNQASISASASVSSVHRALTLGPSPVLWELWRVDWR